MAFTRRWFSLWCDLGVLLGGLGLLLPPCTYGKNIPSQKQERDASPRQEDNHHANPCKHLPHLPGKDKGHNKECPPKGSSSGIAKADFNGDGFADLAIGAPGEETPTGVQNAGAVNVIYGSSNGLTTTNSAVPASQFWSQNSPGIPGASEAGDNFGTALAAGDFNGDGFSDLAIGVAREDITVNGAFGSTTYEDTGAIVVIYGSPAGLTTSDTSVPPAAAFNFTQGGRSDKLQNYSFLGRSLSWGDFNGDGIGDLAIGAPGFSTLPILGDQAGAVWVLYGSRTDGLTTHGNQFWQDDPPLGVSARFDLFGSVLTAGDFNGDGRSELAIGIPGRDFQAVADAGAVEVLFGSQDGLTDVGSRFFDFFGISFRLGNQQRPSVDDVLGSSLAVGDFNGDGRGDLAIGAPGRNDGAGEVFIIHGSASGLSDNVQRWKQDFLLLSNKSEAGDGFGAALATGDFNGDGRADLAVGAPSESFAVNGRAVAEAGEVDVVYGSTSGLSLSSHVVQLFRQGVSGTSDASEAFGIGDTPEAGDHFGDRLTAWNFGRNELLRGVPPRLVVTTDLAIGVPDESVGTLSFAGAVQVLYGSFATNGLSATGSQLWTQNSPGVPGGSETNDLFGLALY
jgi:hypothetical protein